MNPRKPSLNHQLASLNSCATARWLSRASFKRSRVSATLLTWVRIPAATQGGRTKIPAVPPVRRTRICEHCLGIRKKPLVVTSSHRKCSCISLASFSLSSLSFWSSFRIWSLSAALSRASWSIWLCRSARSFSRSLQAVSPVKHCKSLNFTNIKIESIVNCVPN